MIEKLPGWPAQMRPDTLMAYLDCRSASDFHRQLKKLKLAGYPGPSPTTGRHVKAVIDLYIDPQLTDIANEDADEKAAREAAGL